ncbi:ABC-type multidrug transport system, ATPase component [Archaeoglobus sulfaticallidus PM70-1]|uniref:ABC-type multidrug transport system, ATPase component n=1 Tax=Archaeoglobus sulfaticallidus PM70-1 TaxID=387631 RepID=N0BIY9_9EURY|nr:ABC transporter ATP-binding protein [Archaeoglobus sulfaticallidus]AGK60436.1 ABC-type multidrug transport system, ATPase component [Archaeoglobus sulfaticallidus PM70-1]
MMIVIQNLTKIFGKFKALDNLNLEIDDNEVFGFLGPNGAGKTTTINILMGMLQPTSGRVEISGIDVVRNPFEVKKICGYLPERVGFYDNMTARQNLLYFSEFYKIPKNEALKEIDDLLELVGLADSADKKVGEFSKGMKQRLGMANALLNDPEVIFLDEPTSGLDPKGSADFRKIIKMKKKEGKTIFFSSHILSEVKEVCEVVGIISKGRLIAKGRIDELGKDNVRILVEADPKPDPSIFEDFGEVKAENDRFWIISDRDCRTEISKKLFEEGYLIKELHLEEQNLEEIYLSLVEGEA